MFDAHTAPRRDFLQQLTVGGLALTGWPALLHAHEPITPRLSATQADDVDMSWTKKLTGKHKGVFDSPEIASGFGVYRAGLVASQYRDVFKLPASAVTNVVVLRHEGIVLAMNQAFWDAYKVGATKKVTHPFTEAPITKNPALLGAADGIPAPIAEFSLDRQLAQGVVVLACSLAFRDVVDMVANADKVSADAAEQRAKSMLIPGIIMQPSGVFATMVAQEQGCVYVRAS
jgi:hypothetical protein